MLLTSLATLATTLVASLFPAYLANRIPPVMALSQADFIQQTDRKKWIIIGVVCALSLSLTWWNLFHQQSKVLFLCAGLAITFSVFWGMVQWITPTVTLLQRLLTLLGSKHGPIAGRNAIRQVKRSVHIAHALVLAVTINYTGTLILQAMREDTHHQLNREFPFEYVIDANTTEAEHGLSIPFFQQINFLTGGEAIPVYQPILVTTSYKTSKKKMLASIGGLDLTLVNKKAPLTVVDGSIATSAIAQNGVVITKKFSLDSGYQVGDTIQLTPEESPQSSKTNFKVVGVIEENTIDPRNDYLLIISPATMIKRFKVDSIEKIL